MPGGYSEAASRVLTILEESWQAIRARHPEIPPVVIIIASGTTAGTPDGAASTPSGGPSTPPAP